MVRFVYYYYRLEGYGTSPPKPQCPEPESDVVVYTSSTTETTSTPTVETTEVTLPTPVVWVAQSCDDASFSSFTDEDSIITTPGVYYIVTDSTFGCYTVFSTPGVFPDIGTLVTASAYTNCGECV